MVAVSLLYLPFGVLDVVFFMLYFFFFKQLKKKLFVCVCGSSTWLTLLVCGIYCGFVAVLSLLLNVSLKFDSTVECQLSGHSGTRGCPDN